MITSIPIHHVKSIQLVDREHEAYRWQAVIFTCHDWRGAEHEVEITVHPAKGAWPLRVTQPAGLVDASDHPDELPAFEDRQ